MQILSDNPSKLKEALGEGYSVQYYPALDIYTKDNTMLQTLKGMFVSSRLNFEDEFLIEKIKDIAKPTNLPVPKCHVCYNYEQFRNFYKEYLENNETIKVAYDVETTAASYLSPKYRLAGFSLANSVENGCYVILESIDYENPDKEKIINLLETILKKHKIIVFNLQHEYIATQLCVNGLELGKEDILKIDDVYSSALVMKTEGFKADVFKLKVLSNRLLGIDNWATIIDDYIDLAMQIGSSEKFNFNALTELQAEIFDNFYNILKDYSYSKQDAIAFINKIQETYPDWCDQSTIPYTLIPSKMIAVYGCYDSCYLIALYNFFEEWKQNLTYHLVDSMNTPDIDKAYRETMQNQILSGILTLNGIFVSKERDAEVKEKAQVLADKYYNELWKVKSDTTGNLILDDFAKSEYIEKLRKNYILPYALKDLIPEGFEFIKTTPSFYSFECKALNIAARNRAENDFGLKAQPKTGTYKLLQKHLKPFETLNNEKELIEIVYPEFLKKETENKKLSEAIYKPMSAPATLLKLLTKDLQYADFWVRVVLYEYKNLPENKKEKKVLDYLDEHSIFDYDSNKDEFKKVARYCKNTVFTYMAKTYSYKEINDNLITEGLKSLASPIIAYIYNVFTATGCSVKEPKYSAFDFICKLKICRKYLRLISTFIKGSSGGYASQKLIDKNSIGEKYLKIKKDVIYDDKTKDLLDECKDGPNVIFGKWFANVAETGRWTATIHNVPAGAFCKRRFTSRYPGGVILAADMSQMEVRELAVLSKCEGLIETIKDPTVDIHKRTAAAAFDIPYDEVTKTQRKQTKEGIFSIVYGRELDSLAANLFKGDKKAAQRLMDSIFRVYPEIPKYLHNAWSDVQKHGYLVTRRGMPLFINPYSENSSNSSESRVKKKTQNFAIQSGAAYVCGNTLVNVQKLIDKYNMRDKIKIICYIHDSIEIDVSPDVIDIAYDIMHEAFNELATKLYDVPTKGDIVVGVSMGEELDMHKIEKNHYKISGNNSDVLELIQQLSQTYNVDILSSTVEETVNNEENIDWVFIPRAEFQWYTSITPSEYEIVLK